MKLKLGSLVIFTLLSAMVVMVPNGASLAESPRGLGGYELINNLYEPEVVACAKFAVEEHNKENNGAIMFIKLFRGEKQVVSGINYKLDFRTRKGGLILPYEAIVYYAPWKNYRKLVSFKLIHE